MPIVSNSNILTAQKCEQMFYYSVILKLRPRDFPIFIRRGSFGHELMEAGFQCILDGGSVKDAIQAAGVPLAKLFETEDSDTAEMMKVYRHVITFITFTQSDEVAWRPVALENKGMWDISAKQSVIKDEITDLDNLVFGFTPDIIVEFTKGLYKGQLAVLDYKFLAQYMSEVAINMAQQIPKYMIYRNKMFPDQQIRRGAFVQLNTRAAPGATGYKLFLIKWVEPSKKRLARIEYENEILMERVAKLYTQEPGSFLRTVDQNVCDRCFFSSDLCPTDFDGKSVDKIIQREYVVNDYGY